MQFIVTMNGKTGADGADVLEGISFTVNKSNEDALDYCDDININYQRRNFPHRAEDGRWERAQIVEEHMNIIPVRWPGFDYEIIVQLDDRAMQMVMREVDSLDLAKVLMGSSLEVKDKIFKNMSKRAADLLKEEMVIMGDVNPDDIKAAQNKIVSIIAHLEDTGEIVIPGDFEKDLI